MIMRKRVLIQGLLLATLAISIISVSAAPEKSTHKMLLDLRLATLQYKDVAVAESDGYVSTIECIPNMGVHYINFDLMQDLNVDEMKPEVIIYEQKNDKLKLAAVEYVVPALANSDQGPIPWFGDEEPEEGWFNDAPIIFNNHAMEGPMKGHDDNMPWHYDLHVYIWNFNPNGTFEAFNPRIGCQ